MLPPAAVFPAPPATGLQKLAASAARRPGRTAGLVIFLAFATHLLTSGGLEFRYDDYFYWMLAGKFWAGGSFDFQAFDTPFRGYLFPLLLAPLAWLAAHGPVVPLVLTRLVGAAGAALLFGVVGPGLWQAAQRGPAAPAVGWGRRLLFGALGFAFWRGHFHYPLTDFPALLALGAGLWGLLRGRSAAVALLAGLGVAAAVNFRPIYAAALPVAVLLGSWPRLTNAGGGGRGTRRGLAFGAGLALVFGPQLYLNRAHFGANTPLVLARYPAGPNTYLLHLQMGLCHQKYETSVAPDYPRPEMYFRDPAGQQLWQRARPAADSLASAAEYLAVVRQAPAVAAGVWGRHLFNGLDVQYPTPYVGRVYVPTWGLAWANYTALGAGLLVLLSRASTRRRWPTQPAALVLAALALPCLFVLPVQVECRFLLPLHLLLYAALAFGAQPRRAWQNASAGYRLLGVGLYLGWLAGAFACSAQAQAQLAEGPRRLFAAPAQKPAPEPW